MADNLNFAGGDVKLQWVLLLRSILGMFLTTKYKFSPCHLIVTLDYNYLYRHHRFQLT